MKRFLIVSFICSQVFGMHCDIGKEIALLKQQNDAERAANFQSSALDAIANGNATLKQDQELQKSDLIKRLEALEKRTAQTDALNLATQENLQSQITTAKWVAGLGWMTAIAATASVVYLYQQNGLLSATVDAQTKTLNTHNQRLNNLDDHVKIYGSQIAKLENTTCNQQQAILQQKTITNQQQQQVSKLNQTVNDFGKKIKVAESAAKQNKQDIYEIRDNVRDKVKERDRTRN